MNDAEIDRSAYEILTYREKSDEFLNKVRNAPPEIIAAVMADLASTGATGAMLVAKRDACNAILQSKLSSNIITTMERLDKSATFLAGVGIVLTLVIGIAQIIVPLFIRTN